MSQIAGSARRTGRNGDAVTNFAGCWPPPGRMGTDDAVAECKLLLATPFRVFLQEVMMKRMSKREITFRCEMFESVPVVIDRLEHGHAVVKVDGMECRLDITRHERQDLRIVDSRRAYLASWPNRQGDGMLPKGYRPDDDDRLWPRMKDDHIRARLRTSGSDEDFSILHYQQYAKTHQVGELVEADVVRVYRNKVRLRLAKGVYSTLPIADYLDRMPGWTRMNLGRRPILNRMEVILRRIDADRRVIAVTEHGYPRDQDYCNAAAGYRHVYDASESMFRQLPWDRGRPEVPEPRRLPPGVALQRLMVALDEKLAGASDEPSG
jgi:hypothetical protein